MESGARLGARFINVMVDDDEPGLIRDNLGRLADTALPFGLRPAVEAIPYLRLRTLQDVVAAVTGIGCCPGTANCPWPI